MFDVKNYNHGNISNITLDFKLTDKISQITVVKNNRIHTVFDTTIEKLLSQIKSKSIDFDLLRLWYK